MFRFLLSIIVIKINEEKIAKPITPPNIGVSSVGVGVGFGVGVIDGSDQPVKLAYSHQVA
ncbi:MAG: hypothetical protein HZR80_11105 [Candidatus Heimdallarchaeota archaeon]